MTISRDIRDKIVFLLGIGKKPGEIGHELGIPRTTVRRWANRWQTEGHINSKKSPGRPRSTSPDEDSEIAQFSEQNPEKCATEMHLTRRLPCSLRTFRRILKRKGIVLRVARKRENELRSDRVQNLRREWTEGIEWEGWDSRTVWVDETAIFNSQFNRRARRYVRRRPRGRNQPNHWVKNSGKFSVGIIGMLVGDELLPPIVISGGLNAGQYRDFYGWVYWPILFDKFPEGEEFLLLQDNAPCHRGEELVSWVKLHPRLWRAWSYLPPYSPDLNPIEHVWNRIKRALSDRIFLTRDALTREIIVEYNRVREDREYLKNLTSSMPSRIAAVIAAEGGPTRY